MSSRVGVQVGAATAPGELGAVVAEAEELGYGEMWLAEDYFSMGGVASVAAALAATTHIPVGLGVVAARVRHPAVTAMEFATLESLYPGRFMGGIGHGAPEWVRQMGLQPASPLGLLREATSATRQLLDGAELTIEGDYFHFDSIRLRHPPAGRVPIYLGVHGPASLRLSGELADGTLLGWFSSPGYVTWARRQIDEGRVRAGRDGAHRLVVLCLLSVSDDDPEAARRDFGRWGGPMLAAMAGSHQVGEASDALPAFLNEGGDPADLPGRVLEEYAAVGDSHACAATVDRLLEAGADAVVLVPNPAGWRSTAAMVEQIRMAAKLTNMP